MKQLTSRRNLIILSVILLAVMVANALIFVPHFLNSKQMLTQAELEQHQQQLADAARQASQLASKEAANSRSASELSEDLNPLEMSVDATIINLRTSPHPVDMDEEVRETLRLAEVLSFTIRSMAVQGAGDSLMATKTSQIFEQAAMSVEQLQKTY